MAKPPGREQRGLLERWRRRHDTRSFLFWPPFAKQFFHLRLLPCEFSRLALFEREHFDFVDESGAAHWTGIVPRRPHETAYPVESISRASTLSPPLAGKRGRILALPPDRGCVRRTSRSTLECEKAVTPTPTAPRSRCGW